MFLARTAECERTSTEHVVSTATEPAGISSSPPTLSATSTVGLVNVSFITSLSECTCLT